MRLVRRVLSGFALGAAATFVAALLRPRRPERALPLYVAPAPTDPRPAAGDATRTGASGTHVRG